MTFASIEFALLLSACLALYYLLPQRGRALLLLAGSYFFYAYANIVYASLIVFSSLIHYGAAIAIEETDRPGRRRAWMWAAVASSLLVLGYFKYTNFAIDAVRGLLEQFGLPAGFTLNLVLPIGISFYTFQVISYTVDVYRGDIRAERDFAALALFIAFFPQLVAGPIERARDLMPQLKEKHPFRWENMEIGLRYLLWGLLKKVVVADRFSQACMPVYMDPASRATGELLLASLMMFVAIYLDFSAYSDMATGSARLFGVRLTRNFDYPHAAANIAEFWRRWHITMSTWVRDYLFMPLGGFRPRDLRHHAQIMLLTMGFVGLWHGANWTFVVWGLLHGATLVLYHAFYLRVLRRHRRNALLQSLPARLASWTIMMAYHATASVLFFSPNLSKAGAFLHGLVIAPTLRGFDLGYVQAGFAMIAAFWIIHYIQSRSPIIGLWDRLPAFVRGLGYAVLAFVILLGSVGKSQQFIYFQF